MDIPHHLVYGPDGFIGRESFDEVVAIIFALAGYNEYYLIMNEYLKIKSSFVWG
jgi:hypothetical protein